MYYSEKKERKKEKTKKVDKHETAQVLLSACVNQIKCFKLTPPKQPMTDRKHFYNAENFTPCKSQGFQRSEIEISGAICARYVHMISKALRAKP